jgi:hypothetical protein
MRPEVSPALEAAYQQMMAKRPEDRPASMTDVIALLQAPELATDTGTGNVTRASRRRPAPQACNETPIIDSAIFARDVAGDATLVDRELNLRDLVMDVLPEVGVAGDPCAVHDELEGLFNDRELSLRELATEGREEAAPPRGPKPRPPGHKNTPR